MSYLGLAVQDLILYGKRHEGWLKDTRFKHSPIAQQILKDLGVYRSEHFNYQFLVNSALSDVINTDDMSLTELDVLIAIYREVISIEDSIGTKAKLKNFVQGLEAEIDRRIVSDISHNISKEDASALAQAVYGVADNINGFSTFYDYSSLGLELEDLMDPESGFQAKVYHRAGQLVVSFAGTDPNTVVDIETDVLQAFGFKTKQYNQAEKLARKIVDNNPNTSVSFVGHSLGGGLAAVAGASTGLSTQTFNAAGVHENSLKRLENSEYDLSKITNYVTAGEILTLIQDKTFLPDALGEQIDTLGDQTEEGYSPLRNKNIKFRLEKSIDLHGSLL